ncbi:MAG: zf-HC2 domain-containing protein [Candidatus Poribacteria bacterium]|nr:zf-HC2 domain-containing protein [Candidatus Poribacteria bacterium]
MNHKRIQGELSAYLDNELTPSRREQIETHLRSCSECSEMLLAFETNRQMITDFAHPAPSTLKDAVMAKIHTQLQDELSAYLDDELAPVVCQRIETHLRSCNECSEMLSAFRENRERVSRLEQPAPASIHDTVMAKVRQHTADVQAEESTPTGWLSDLGRWFPDLGRWFFRPVTAGATGILTLALILGALYFSPTAPQYEETFDLYFGLYTEQLEDNPLKSNVVKPINATLIADGDNSITGTVDDADLFLDLYLENVGD